MGTSWKAKASKAQRDAEIEFLTAQAADHEQKMRSGATPAARLKAQVEYYATMGQLSKLKSKNKAAARAKKSRNATSVFGRLFR